MGEDFLDNFVMETTDMVEGAIQGCASLGNQHMDVGMEIDAISEGLDHCNYSWHQFLAWDSLEVF